MDLHCRKEEVSVFAERGRQAMSVVRDIPKNDPFWAEYWRYVEEVWWPAIRKDPTQYNYWRSPANVRMGKFKIVRSEGQEVFDST